MDTKICSKCGRELPITEFHKGRGYKDGYNCWCKECVKQYQQDNKETIAERKKQHYQHNKEAILEQQKQYYQGNKEEITERKKRYYQGNKEAILEQKKQYNKTPMGRAINLVGSYKQSDKDANRGECTLTAQWIIDNIFTSKCHWCGETDWHKLGCDRIDNDKPHTPDNVNPCCDKCNAKRGTKTYEEFLKIIKAPVTYV